MKIQLRSAGTALKTNRLGCSWSQAVANQGTLLNSCRQACNLDLDEAIHSQLDFRPRVFNPINNRNLKTFQTDLVVTERLIEEAPDHVTVVSESGIRSVGDAQRVLDAGANAILVGEALMRANVPGEEVQSYLALTASGTGRGDPA